VARLDVREIGGIAASVVGMPVGAAWAGIGGALALGHADAVYVEVGNVFGSGFGLVGSIRQAANYEPEQRETDYS
jgi:hypothetical protein